MGNVDAARSEIRSILMIFDSQFSQVTARDLAARQNRTLLPKPLTPHNRKPNPAVASILQLLSVSPEAERGQGA
jgi:hypothetical protein